jgi:hypothetical protein
MKPMELQVPPKVRSVGLVQTRTRQHSRLKEIQESNSKGKILEVRDYKGRVKKGKELYHEKNMTSWNVLRMREA